MKKEEILNKLKLISKKLRHSVKRRDCTWNFYNLCIDNFGSFNKAKEKAGLEIRKDIRFRVITEDNNKFIKEIGWLK